MMSRAVAAIVVLALIAPYALAQPEVEAQQDIERVAAEQQLQERIQRFVDMGLPQQAAVFVAALSESGMSPAEIMLMIMMAEEGGDDTMGMMMLLNAMKQSASSQPVVIDRGESLLVIEKGTLYIIDLEGVEVEATLKYQQGQALEDSAIMSLLGPMIGQARGKAQQAACMSNLKQLGLALHMHGDAHDGAIPGEDWVEATVAYAKNRQIYTCPSRPELPVGYAMNEQLIGMRLDEVADPSRTVWLFESNIGGESPVGGMEAVPAEGVHNGGVNCVFVDGHVKWVTAAQALDLIAQPVQ
ncbi:MAG: DUF1559 domain-containing protein [Armatimonadota bacterium]|nr:DUF1559 domain-containing protein [Armatimonadota bacterium]